MKLVHDFREFLKEYKVLAVAVGFIMATAVNDLMKSLVTNVLMPLLNPLIPHGTWETAVFSLGKIKIEWGLFLNSFLHFLLLALVVYLVVKKLLERPKKNNK